jgi:hypothetical protein
MEGGKESTGGANFKSVRSIWQERANQTAREKEKSDSQPPPSPSSKASAALGGGPVFDPFAGYGIAFMPDNTQALVVSLLPETIPGVWHFHPNVRGWTVGHSVLDAPASCNHGPTGSVTLILDIMLAWLLQLKKVAYGGAADRAGVPLFPGDILQEIDGIDVYR